MLHIMVTLLKFYIDNDDDDKYDFPQTEHNRTFINYIKLNSFKIYKSRYSSGKDIFKNMQVTNGKRNITAIY